MFAIFPQCVYVCERERRRKRGEEREGKREISLSGVSIAVGYEG